VIDSGVNRSHPHISRLDGGWPEDDFIDRLGHGTAVMAAIQEKAPDAEYFAVRVFDRELRTSIDRLVEAIEWSVENRMDVVNLSLGTANPAHAGRFAPFISRVLIVSAAEVYPGLSPGVIRVAADGECARDRFRVEDGVFYASPYARLIPGVAPERNLNGASFAVASMTGFVVRECAELAEVSYAPVLRRLRAIGMSQSKGC
jgi:hypothetical protein